MCICFLFADAMLIGFRNLANQVRTLGASWESASTPFIKFVGERAIAHVGVLEIPLQVMGQARRAAGIHGVATHPDFRRQGHYRACMEAALAYAEPRYDTLLLTTEQPELYEPFGFRVVPESRFEVMEETIASLQSVQPSQSTDLRRLDLEKERDRHLLLQAIETRIPVSNIVGVYPEKALFLFNEVGRSLYYSEALNAILDLSWEEATLHLFELVSSREISLREILQVISQRVEAVVIYWSGDRLQIPAHPVSHVLEEAHLMVKGSFPAEGQAFMLPRSARC
ncbi:MAG: GNAT family N-acetyltransferase [Oculatellaceae cyanobacterium Prado106]|nr:GNAT family N-acetyltransferase [Oculatellaceae cyanobacterium Prado106]